MYFSWTMSRYCGRLFFSAFLAAFACCLSIILLADMVELLRRTAEKDVPFQTVLTMSLLRLPSLSTQVLPFSVLLGSIATLIRLSRNNELVVTRAAGISAWQFLAPALALSFILGIFATTVYNPVAAAMVSRFERMEARHIKGRTSLLSVKETGLWIRDATGDERLVIHALRGNRDDKIRLENTILFRLSPEEAFSGRIDADRAVLEEGHWVFENAFVSAPESPSRQYAVYRIATNVKPEQVLESFVSPQSISFWDLPGFIKLTEEAGFSARQHRIHLHSLISTPFLFCTMVLIAAVFTMRIARIGGLGQFAAGAVFSGFLFFFLTRFSLALGSSGVIPPFLAAWSPAIITALLGVAMLFHLEDG